MEEVEEEREEEEKEREGFIVECIILCITVQNDCYINCPIYYNIILPLNMLR